MTFYIRNFESRNYWDNNYYWTTIRTITIGVETISTTTIGTVTIRVETISTTTIGTVTIWVETIIWQLYAHQLFRQQLLGLQRSGKQLWGQTARTRAAMIHSRMFGVHLSVSVVFTIFYRRHIIRNTSICPEVDVRWCNETLVMNNSSVKLKRYSYILCWTQK